MLEPKHKKLAPKHVYYGRLLKSAMLAFVLLIISLLIGIIGYKITCGFSWTDSLLNASMILGGMGPVNAIESELGKIFASIYAIYSGVAFLGIFAIVVAPVFHRFMHRFHIEDQDEN